MKSKFYSMQEPVTGHNESKLQAGSGQVVTSNKQATAVAAAEARKAGKFIPREKKSRDRGLR